MSWQGWCLDEQWHSEREQAQFRQWAFIPDAVSFFSAFLRKRYSPVYKARAPFFPISTTERALMRSHGRCSVFFNVTAYQDAGICYVRPHDLTQFFWCKHQHLRWTVAKKYKCQGMFCSLTKDGKVCQYVWLHCIIFCHSCHLFMLFMSLKVILLIKQKRFWGSCR